MRQFFKTSDKNERKSKSRTLRDKKRARLERERFLNRPEVKAIIQRIHDADAVSTVMQLKGMIK